VTGRRSMTRPVPTRSARGISPRVFTRFAVVNRGVDMRARVHVGLDQHGALCDRDGWVVMSVTSIDANCGHVGMRVAPRPESDRQFARGSLVSIPRVCSTVQCVFSMPRVMDVSTIPSAMTTTTGTSKWSGWNELL